MKAQFEKIPKLQNTSVHAFVYEGDTFDAPWHFHPEFELTFIEKGEGIRYVANSVEPFIPGDMVLLGRNLPHCWKERLVSETGVKSLVFQWDDSLLGENWIEKKEFYNIKELLIKSARGIKFSPLLSSKFHSDLNRIIGLPPFEKLMAFVEVLQKLALTTEYQLLGNEHYISDLNTKTNARIDKVYNYIHTHYSKKIMLQDVAHLVSMGEEAFCRFFKKSLNKSLFAFINEYRVTMVCKQLIESNKQVKQIAYNCGFESLPFFYKQFQKYKGCSPLAFRKVYRKI
ncbi:AraC family transcriptional regulator [Tamlana carrageenivorans]|uniref:AraC family transcriptional regulator n=1 Tax=Pseudotamlana carrageenivorans TaxID=2069432 RepID=A0A2I7SK05_9FLAO|nr:AraC family transcriptional regulator [Tamlana carrageenivorans]